jgi:hypothetical protein
VLAVIFGIIGIRRKARKGLAIAGLATAAVAIVFAIIGLAIVNKATNALSNCFDAFEQGRSERHADGGHRLLELGDIARPRGRIYSCGTSAVVDRPGPGGAHGNGKFA